MVFNRRWRETLNVLAGEGGFAVYGVKGFSARSRRVAKYAVNSIAHFLCGSRDVCEAKILVYTVGANQLRLRSRYGSKYFGEGAFFVNHPKLKTGLSGAGSPYISFASLTRQLSYLLFYLISGKKRGLNLFFISYQGAIEKYVESHVNGVLKFFCFNDQIYECSSLILAIRRCTSGRSVVVQHGLVLSHRFYFPVNADEFWAWGELSRRYFSSRVGSEFKLVGRFPDDIEKFEGEFNGCLNGVNDFRLLIAPSYDKNEVMRLLEAGLKLRGRVNVSVFLKLHPATKNVTPIELFCSRNRVVVLGIEEEMGVLAERVDGLLTSFSTSVLDFLLIGKPVFVERFNVVDDFPSREYCFSASDVLSVASDDFFDRMSSMNEGRIKFLREAINV